MRACWLKWVGRDWSISADYIWLNYSDANNGAGHRAQNRFRARDLHRYRRLPKPRQARVVLRPGAAQPPVGNLDLLGDGIAPRQQEAEEPAHILM